MNKVGKSHEILNKGFFNSEQILSKERTRTNQVYIHKRDFSSFIQRVWKWHVSPFHSPSSKKYYYFSMHMKCTFQFPVCNVMMYLLYCAILYLTAAHAQIHGEAAVYVKVGSTISLTCTINLYSVPPPDITWYHGSKVILFWRQNSNETLK